MAQAQVSITAVDKTQAAISSAIRGMKNLDRTAKITAKAMRLAFFGIGLVTGGAVAGVTALVSAASKSTEGAKSINRLKDALNDPILQDAASRVTKTLVDGFTASVDLTAGLVRNLSNIAKTEVFKNPENLLKLFAAFSSGTGGLAVGQMLAAAEGQAAAIEESVGGRGGPRKRGFPAIPKVDEMTRMENYHKAQMERLNKEAEAQKKAAEEAKKLAKELNDLNVSTMTAFEKAAYDFDVFSQAVDRVMAAGMIDSQVASDRMMAYLNQVLPEYIVESKRADPVAELKKQTDQMQEFAKAAAQSIQSSFADFLFDPFENGLRGMLGGFLNVIRRMIAEVAASAILSSIFSPYKGKGGWMGAIADALIPKAMGGPVSKGTPYLVGERGPELFVPGTSGGIVPNNKLGMGGGVTVAPVYNIDARGATADLQRSLPGILQENNRRIFDELDRRYGIGR